MNSLVKENIVLWTHSQTLTDLRHIAADIQAADGRSPGSWWEQAGQNRPAIKQIGLGSLGGETWKCHNILCSYSTVLFYVPDFVL